MNHADLQGNIFNIQKFSIHDGPGIRTTVFFKGCPLRCAWCANPESQETRIQITYDSRKCTGCRTCARVCPQGAVSPVLSGEASSFCDIRIDSGRCIGCQTCVGVCPGHALKAEGRLRSVKEVAGICLQDLDFYEESDGGVTFSGGECFCQPEFAGALIRELKSSGIHVAAETTGAVESSVFREIAPLFDLLLFDVKHYDSEAHRAGTGVPNEQILENLSWAVQQGFDLLPRIPVIPGFNDSPEDAGHFADLLRSIGLTRVQLLPFHQFGERKYELLSRDYRFHEVKALYPEDLKDYQQILMSRGLDCFF